MTIRGAEQRPARRANIHDLLLAGILLRVRRWCEACERECEQRRAWPTSPVRRRSATTNRRCRASKIQTGAVVLYSGRTSTVGNNPRRAGFIREAAPLIHAFWPTPRWIRRPRATHSPPEALALLDALYGTALRLTRDADRAQDLVQDTYLKAFRARARFTAGHQPEGLAVHDPA